MFLAFPQRSQNTMTEIKPGIYRIVVAGSVDSARLTRHGRDSVTVLPAGAAPELEQEWVVSIGKDGHIIIAVPSPIRPGSYLSWDGNPEKPEPGERVVFKISEFPLYEWRLGIEPGFRFFLYADNSDLGIQVGPETIFPPNLRLSREDQIHWLFELVRSE